MSLGEYGYKAGGHPQPLTKVRLKLTDAGDVIVIGFDKFDFQREVTNPELLVKFDTEYIHFTNKDMYSYGKGYNYICYFICAPSVLRDEGCKICILGNPCRRACAYLQGAVVNVQKG